MRSAIRGCSMMLSASVAAFVLAGCNLLVDAAAPAAEGEFTQTLNVTGPIDLDISTGSGRITIKNGSAGRVEIHGRIRAGGWFGSSGDADDAVRRIEMNPPIEQSGQTIRIGRSDNRDLRNVSISYDIVAPAQSNIRAHSGSGGISVDGINGSLEAGTGSGGITLRDVKGELHANTGSGGIHGTAVQGGVHMQTGSGGIDVQGEQTAPWELRTGSGGVDIDLPANASFDLSAHTGSGGIDVGYPMTVQGRIGNRHDVTGKVGTGMYPLEVRTGSGHIRIQ